LARSGWGSISKGGCLFARQPQRLHQAADCLAVRTTSATLQPLNAVLTESRELGEGLLCQASRKPMPPK
jgi:hypothetical protein